MHNGERMKKPSINFSFLLIKTISMALILTIPLSFISFSKRQLIGISDIETPNFLSLSLLAIGWGLMLFAQYFQVNKEKNEIRKTIHFFIELFITFIISIVLVILICIIGVLYAIISLIYFTNFYLIVKYGLKKWLNLSS